MDNVFMAKLSEKRLLQDLDLDKETEKALRELYQCSE